MEADHKRVRAREPDNVPAIFAAPLHFSSNQVSEMARYIKPVVPQLIALSVCLLLVPLVVLLSLYAGWFVWRNVAVGWEAPVYLQYGDGLPPYAEIQLPSLIAQQPYAISLRLAVPATESNYALGNFMTTLTLSSSSNKTLASIRRPSITVPASHSFWTRRSDVVDITVPLFSFFVPGTSHVLAKLELGRRDGWKSLGEGHGLELSVLSASLQGGVQLEGLRGLVTRFPLFSAVISCVIFFIISLLVIAGFFVPALQRTRKHIPTQSQPHTPHTQRQREKQRGGLSDDSEDYIDDDEAKSWRRSVSSGRIRPPLAFDADVKAEAPGSIIPEAPAGSSSTSGTPLRRRRSRLSQSLAEEDS